MLPRDEAARLLDLCKGDLLRALNVLEHQFATLHARAQILMSLAGITLTVTGFSGRIIAGTNLVAQIAIIGGLATAMLSAVWLATRVMPIRWVTSEADGTPEEILERVILRRDAKTRAYAQGGVILCLGFALYCLAVSLMLLNPH